MTMTFDLPPPRKPTRRLKRLATSAMTVAIILEQTLPTLAQIDNQATVNGTYNSTNYSATSTLVQVPVATQAPALTVAKAVFAGPTTAATTPGIVDVGDTITYEYTVTNTGNTTLTSVLPVEQGVKFGSTANNSGTGALGAFTAVLPATLPVTLTPGQNAKFRAVYTLSQLDVDRAAGTTNAVTNSAVATGNLPNAGGPFTSTVPGTAQTTIPAGPLLAISKTAALSDTNSNTQADTGETILYTYTVTNTGNVPITGVTITDTHEGTALAAGTVANETLISDGPLAAAPYSTPSVNGTANDGTWNTLQPGAVIRFTYTHTVTQTEVDNG